MSIRREVTVERLLSRKGFMLRFELKYVLLFPLLFLVLGGLNKDTFTFAGFLVPPLTTVNDWLFSGLAVAGMAILLASLLETIVLNVSLFDYQNSKVYQFLKDAIVSFFAMGLFVSKFEHLQIVNNWSILVCVFFVSIVTLEIKLLFLELRAFLILSLLFMIGHAYGYGLHVSHELTQFLLISLILYTVQWIVSTLIRKSFMRNVLNPKKFFRNWFMSLFLMVSFVITYVGGLWIMNKFDMVQILSYKELLVLYLGYFAGNLTGSFHWSHISTRKETHTYARY